jgi:hypothetical protein
MDVDLSELSECIKRANEIIDLRNTLEETMKVQGLKVDIDDTFREVSEVNPFIGISKNSGNA